MADAISPEYFPFLSRWHMTLDGHRIHYVDEGAGVPVVLVGGLLGWSFHYRKLMQALLKQRFRVVAIDPLGFGLSDKPKKYDYSLENHLEQLTYFLAQEQIPRFHLICHGSGTIQSLGYAVQHRERIRRIVMLSPNIFPNMPWLDMEPLMLLPGAMQLLARDTAFYAKRHLSRGVRTAPMSAPERKLMLFPYLTKRGRLPWYQCYNNFLKRPRQSVYNLMNEIILRLKLLQPKGVLCIGGEEDPTYYPQVAERVQQVLPDSLVLNFPKAGHFLLEDFAEDVIPTICRFLG